MTAYLSAFLKNTILKHTTACRFLVSVSLCFSASGCVTDKFTDQEVNGAINQAVRPQALHTPSFIKIKTAQQVRQAHRINLVGRVPLIDAMRRFLPDYQILPMDSGVVLDQSIDVNAVNMPAHQFIEYLGALSGLDIQINDQALELRSFITQEWMLGALSGGKKMSLSSNASLNKGLEEEGESAALSEDVSYDEWDNLLAAARDILHISSSAPTGLRAYVYGSRSVGKVVAGGTVEEMRRLDEYLTGLQTASTQQVAIEVQAFDVMLTDDRGSGVNWQEFAALGSSINGNPLALSVANSTGSPGLFLPNALADEGIWRGRLGYQSSQLSAQAVVQFLSRYGQVELLNQPNLTVRNGGFAIMHAGEQLSYIAETEVVRETGTDTVAVSANVKQLKVGVSLAVSPKLLDDKRILLNIWPVVSSIQGFDEFNSDPIPVRVPRLALQELSTEVIVESGKTIQLGGLIRKSMTDRLQTLPFRHGITGALLKPFFHADSKQLERRELVIMVTPRLVTAGQ